MQMTNLNIHLLNIKNIIIIIIKYLHQRPQEYKTIKIINLKCICTLTQLFTSMIISYVSSSF